MKNSDDLNVQGQIALITGAARGLEGLVPWHLQKRGLM